MSIIDRDILLLLDQLKAKDQRAFNLFDKTYRSWLEIVAMTILRDRIQSQEIVQEFFIDFWNKELFHSIQINTDKSLRSYLFTSIKNRCLNFIKKDKIRKKRLDLLLKDLPEDYIFPVDAFESAALSERLVHAVQQLSEGQAGVFKLAYVEGKSRKTIAHELGIAEETVKKQLARALKILRAILGNEKNV